MSARAAAITARIVFFISITSFFVDVLFVLIISASVFFGYKCDTGSGCNSENYRGCDGIRRAGVGSRLCGECERGDAEVAVICGECAVFADALHYKLLLSGFQFMFAEVDFRDTALAEAVERVLKSHTAEGEAENPEVAADEGFDLYAVFSCRRDVKRDGECR